MSKAWITLPTLLGSALLIFLLWRSPPTELTDLLSNTAPKPSYPNAFIINSKTKQYDETGKLSYSIHSETTNYYDKTSDGPEIIFVKPKITIYEITKKTREQTATLTVSSDRGEGNEKQDRLVLVGNVVLEQVAVDGSTTQLKTDQLNVQPNRRYAETTKPVIITDKTGITSATGLKVFFDDKRIELLSNVKGKYAPQ
ncbi:MAG: lipopolysaccharide export system protein LptC [Cellvibrionaceae bacterium]|jgi:lipopolysaccharide export system protein LptC